MSNTNAKQPNQHTKAAEEKAKAAEEEAKAQAAEAEAKAQLKAEAEAAANVTAVDKISLQGQAQSEEKAKKYKPGLYCATRNVMYNGETGQSFTPVAGIKINKEQLESTWMQLQLEQGTVKEYEGQ